MFGKNLESACKAYQYKNYCRLSKEADDLADEIARYEAGSPEWKMAMVTFVQICNDAEANGTPITR